MKVRLLVLLVALGVAPEAFGAGSITVTTTAAAGGYTRYDVAWTSDAAGAVSGNTLTLVAGHVEQLLFIPGAAASQPTDLYDVQLQNSNDVDILNDGTTAGGADRSNATSAGVLLSPRYFNDATTTFELVVANAGNAKSGTVVIWVGP